MTEAQNTKKGRRDFMGNLRQWMIIPVERQPSGGLIPVNPVYGAVGTTIATCRRASIYAHAVKAFRRRVREGFGAGGKASGTWEVGRHRSVERQLPFRTEAGQLWGQSIQCRCFEPH